MSGELPIGWSACTLGDIVERIETGKSVKCNERPPLGEENGLVKISAVTWGKFNEQESKTLFDSSHLKPEEKIQLGDFLISRANTLELVGSCVLVKQLSKSLYLSDKVLRLVLADESKTWLLTCLRTQNGRKQIESLATGNQLSMRNISQQALKVIQIPLPPLAEQTRIAQKLDELLAQVDTLKARIDAIPALLKRFRQSVLAAAVSGRLTEDWRLSLLGSDAKNGLPVPEQSTVSATWISIIHDEIADVIDPHPSHRTPSEDPNGIPYIGIGDVKKLGVIDFENARKVSRSVLDEHKERYSINDGDFIFGKIGTIGSATKIPTGVEYTISANVILVQPIRGKVVPSYHFLFWCSPLALEISAKGSKATSQAAFGIKKMRKAELLYPPMDEQTEIVRRVEQLFAFADQLEAKVASAKSRIDHLTQSILAQAFRGELVPQDPNDEPANVLLQRSQAKRGRKASA
ncbi:restriction endonuclease subunit S [Pseudomonas sp. ACM7]|uniref:restriction endonuclease subunit S n=1 Tax=Pseudomonas sp. ACM7 TaxID=2052956 RepID=UPI001012B558|nr:restriction endonuclease subunit S [Pseudomonas sp. ACM7]